MGNPSDGMGHGDSQGVEPGVEMLNLGLTLGSGLELAVLGSQLAEPDGLRDAFEKSFDGPSVELAVLGS